MTYPAAQSTPAGRTQLAHTRLIVPGIRCAGCIAKLERGLPLQPGIVEARVHFGNKSLALTHDPALAMPELIAAVERIGFSAEPALDQPAGPTELPLLLKSLAVASFAAMNVMLLSVGIWSGAQGPTRDLFHWLSALIALPAIAYAGRPFFSSAWAALRARRTNMDVPISIGILLTSGMSLFETITGGPHAWFDGATMLLAFLLGGRVLDAMAQDRARSGVAALRRQLPAGGMITDDANIARWHEASAIVPGMRLLVAAGERIAADGLIESGQSLVDRALITGESVPVAVGPGDRLDAGALNIGAPMTVVVSHSPASSGISEISRLMEEVASDRSHYRRISARISAYYAPFVHTLAALSFAGWMIAGLGWHGSVLIAVAVLLITCPCALGLAVPVAQVISASALMQRGILVKDGAAFERLAEVDVVLLDKTGTLTTGRPQVVGLDALCSDERAIALALAQASRHPLSRAITDALTHARDTGAPQADVRKLFDVCETPGEGMSAHLSDGTTVALTRPRSGMVEGQSVALRINGDDRHILTFVDAPRPDMVSAIDQLRAMHLSPSILSGDTASAVAEIARATGMTAQFNVRPEDKIASITRLQGGGHRVLMVGDGLNDGPALAAAHAAIAPASASDVGRQAADIVFLGDSLNAVPMAVAAARQTMRIVRQNIALAILYNLIAVPVAVAGLVTPLIAAVAMSGSSLLVVGNAMRLWRLPS